MQLPWYARIGAKIVLSRLPMAYRHWKLLGLFSHGEMQEPDYAFQVFEHHYKLSGIGGPFVGLEMGPGDSLFSAVIAKAFGATHCHLIDAGDFAGSDIEPYHAMASYLRSKGLTPPDLAKARSREDVLTSCGATYQTDGLSGYLQVPDQSIDFIWSHAVLEHIRRVEFLEVMRETRRALKPNGVATHVVDLRDHLGGSLNNLRIGSRLWEQEWFTQAGFYTNRLRFSEMIDLFDSAGLTSEIVAKNEWPNPPLYRSALAPEFRHLSDDELRVQSFTVILRRKPDHPN
jgi:SAM-dependent methyltransferase